MAKSELKLMARISRQNGKSIKAIANDLKVSSSTVSLWCKDIRLSEEQIAQLQKNSLDPYYGRRLGYVLKQQRARKEKIEKIKLEAKQIVGHVNDRDMLIAGVALYWAEGFKKDKMVGFSNTDPAMVRSILSWFRNIFGVTNERIKLRLVINESHKYREREIIEYWEKQTGINREDFYKTTFQKVVWNKVYENPENYFGVLRVRIMKSTDLLRKIIGMIEGLSDEISGRDA